MDEAGVVGRAHAEGRAGLVWGKQPVDRHIEDPDLALDSALSGHGAAMNQA